MVGVGVEVELVVMEVEEVVMAVLVVGGGARCGRRW
jgi:hypothetical protein